MRVLDIHAGWDIAGAGYLVAQGFRRHPQPDVEHRSAVLRRNYLQYPQDMPWSEHRQAWREADVLHLHNNWATMKHLRPRRPRMPTVISYHGSDFRQFHKDRLAEQIQRGAVGAVSTLDLWAIDPGELYWLPQCHDTRALGAMRQRVGGGRLRIGHAPTARAIKSTEAFLAAAAKLPGVEVVLIEGKPWLDCLQIKATCDVLFDQAILGYGNNAIEAWAMGIPVVCGAAPDTLAEYRRRFGQVPFVEVTPDTIGDGLELLLDEVQREHWGQVGRGHVTTWHDEYPVQMAAWLYRKAMGGAQCLEPPRPAVGAQRIRSYGGGGSSSSTPGSPSTAPTLAVSSPGSR